jgi:hypothetical protein
MEPEKSLKGAEPMNRHPGISRGRIFAAALPLAVLLATGSCKWGVPDYTLTVTLENGVTGTPEAGQHAYKELTTITLNYTPVNPLNTVEVFINGTIRKAGLSTVIMYGDGYTLTARLVDFRGSYKVTMSYTDTSVTAPDPFVITITGADLLSGTFTDERGYHGTWAAAADTLTLAYWDWDFYVLSTTPFNMGYSSGIFSGGGLTGSWMAVKQ